jgi:MtN3 and saliva related transmembrane protein
MIGFITAKPLATGNGGNFALTKLIIMNSTQLLGLVAGACTTIAFLPQVIKTWKSRTAKDLSLGMFSFFCFGVLLWLIYGIMMHDLPVIIANLFTLVLASILLFFKLSFKESRQ